MKRRMREQQGLGQAVDARLRREQAALEERATLGQAGAAPLSSGGTAAGGGPVTTDPALPESFVTGLAGGTGNPYLAGELTITGSGTTEVTQDLMAGEIDVHSPAYTAGDGLDLISEEFAVDSSVVRTSGNQSVAGLKTFSTLPQSPATPTADADLTTKDYVDERTKVVHRQVFHAAGSKDSVNGNNEINLPWFFTEYPAGSSTSNLTIDTYEGVDFSDSESPCVVTSNPVRIVWTSTEFGSVVVTGLQLCFAVPTLRLGNYISLAARIRANVASRLDSIFLSINDQSGDSASNDGNLIEQISDDTWSTVQSTALDTSALGDEIVIVLTIQGTSEYTNVGQTNVQIDWIAIEQLE